MKRILLKLSGEALAGEKHHGFDEPTVTVVAKQVKKLVDDGVQVGIVIGGGNFWRGRTSETIDRTKADQIGMLATVMNCIYVSEIFRSVGMKTAVLTPFECGSITKLYSKDRASKYFAHDMVVFLQGEQDILISLPIQQLYYGLWRLRQRVSIWQKLSMGYTTAIQRQIQMQRNMTKFLSRRLSIRNLRLSI